jgi:hypothetical protein
MTLNIMDGLFYIAIPEEDIQTRGRVSRISQKDQSALDHRVSSTYPTLICDRVGLDLVIQADYLIA